MYGLLTADRKTGKIRFPVWIPEAYEAVWKDGADTSMIQQSNFDIESPHTVPFHCRLQQESNI